MAKTAKDVAVEAKGDTIKLFKGLQDVMTSKGQAQPAKAASKAKAAVVPKKKA